MTDPTATTTRAAIVLSPRDGPFYSFGDIGKPGTLSATFLIDAGALDEFTADPKVRDYLASRIPVLAVFEDECDAAGLERMIAGGRVH